MAVDRADALLRSPGKIALGPTSLCIWCEWKWTRISWSPVAILLDNVASTSECNGLASEILLYLSHRCWKPHAKLFAEGFERLLPVRCARKIAACCLQWIKDSRSNIQYFACVEVSKLIVDSLWISNKTALIEAGGIAKTRIVVKNEYSIRWLEDIWTASKYCKYPSFVWSVKTAGGASFPVLAHVVVHGAPLLIYFVQKTSFLWVKFCWTNEGGNKKTKD